MLNLEGNQVHGDGAIALAKGLAANKGLQQLNLLNQTGARYGDPTLTAFLQMFDTNVTLLKITWRLESRQSFRLNKLLVRNNDIDRRIKAGKEYAELLPEGATTTASTTPHATPAPQPPVSMKPPPVRATSSTARASTSEPSAGANGKTLSDKLAALELEEQRAIAALKAEFTAKTAALKAHVSSGAPRAAKSPSQTTPPDVSDPRPPVPQPVRMPAPAAAPAPAPPLPPPPPAAELDSYSDMLVLLYTSMTRDQLATVATRKIVTQAEALGLPLVQLDGLDPANKPLRSVLWQRAEAKPGTYPILYVGSTGFTCKGEEVQDLIDSGQLGAKLGGLSTH